MVVRRSDLISGLIDNETAYPMIVLALIENGGKEAAKEIEDFIIEFGLLDKVREDTKLRLQALSIVSKL